MVTGSRDFTAITVYGSNNNVEDDEIRSRIGGTITGDNNIVSINDPIVSGTRMFGDFVSWGISGNGNTMNLNGEFKVAGIATSPNATLGGTNNRVNLTGHFRRGAKLVEIDGAASPAG